MTFVLANPLTNKLSAGVGGVVRLGLTASQGMPQMVGSVRSRAATMGLIGEPLHGGGQGSTPLRSTTSFTPSLQVCPVL